MSIRILYLDHESNNLNSMMATFRRDGEVFLAKSTDEGLDILRENKIDVVFADHHMPGITGLEFLKMVSEEFPVSRRILLTGHAYNEEFKHAIKMGYVHHYINKPWDEQELRGLINIDLTSDL